jgi:hypothetical protein
MFDHEDQAAPTMFDLFDHKQGMIRFTVREITTKIQRKYHISQRLDEAEVLSMIQEGR